MMAFDLLYTLKHKKFLKYETSFILSFYYKKTRLSYAVLLTILSEIGLVFVSSFIFVHKFDVEIIAIVALLVGLIHIVGFCETRKFILSHNI